MNARTRRGIAGGISIGFVGAILIGAAAFGANAGAVAPEPAPTWIVEPAGELVDVDAAIAELEAERAEAERVEAARVAVEAAATEAARIEAERVAAEQAAADQAARDAAARQAPAAPSAPQAPAAPAAPAPVDPGPGDQQAGECREYNDANECTAYYTP